MDAGVGGGAGGIRALLELIEEHPDAFAYDWRARFGMGLECLAGGRMSWREAWQLTTRLARDPTSHVAAAVNGWDYPVSHEFKVLADLYDLTLTANTDKKKRGRITPYPRPWPTKQHGSRSAAPSVDQATVRAALAARGH